MSSAVTSLDEFEQVVNSVYGIFLDCTMGFRYALQEFERAQQHAIQRLRGTSPGIANLEYLDSTPMSYGRGDPSTPEAVELHRISQGEFKARMGKGGPNLREIANLCIVSLYQYWEDHYRGDLAEAVGITKNDLKSPVFGDLRQLRRSILHNKAIALPEVERNEVLRWFNPGDPIQLDERMFEEMICQVKRFLIQLRERHAA